MTRREAVKLAKGAAAFLYEEDPEHVQGGCSDVSELIAAFLKKLGVSVEVVYGVARRGEVGDPFWHAWLDISGERFDPVLWIFHRNLKQFLYEVKPEVREALYCTDFDDPEEMGYQLESLEDAYEADELSPKRPELIEDDEPED